jgi:WD40 repeat protein
LRANSNRIAAEKIRGPNRARVVTSSRDRTVRVWDSMGGKQIEPSHTSH